mmetsp:Transcript_4979/g.12104  ORF Transcript_4979/g.12104 Transcript_4979/m.12104 type:complete len:491 (-) Transcript_4979:225-1697(-)
MYFCKLLTGFGLLNACFNVGRVGAGPAGLRGAGQTHQVLVFDAGSSGTRIHVFNIFTSAGSQGEQMPQIDLKVRDKQSLKVKPGLSSFAERDDLVGVQRNIEELLEFTKQFVPESRRSSTPMLLKATAGLRAVAAEKAEAVLTRVRETLSASGYRFQPEWADIIQGKEEGGLAWVAANYLQGTFEQKDGRSLGVIEMGGGSTQVTFEIQKSDQIAISDEFTFTAGGKEYRLYAHSYLGYGQDHAQARMRALTPAAELQDPCYPKGYERTGPMGSSSWVQGSGDGASCRTNIETRLLSASEDAPGQYSKELPLKPGNFIATENFFYVQKDVSMGFEDRIVRESDWEAAAESTCKAPLKPTEQQVADMHSGNADAGNPKTCFGLSYQGMLLRALKASSPGIDVRVAHKVNGGDVDWALGAALVHFLQGHAAHDPDAFPSLGLPIVVLLIVSGLLTAWLAARRLAPSLCSTRKLAQAAGINPSKIGAGSSPAE